MRRIKAYIILAAIFFAASAYAETSATRLQLQRDPTYEQNLRYIASADTAITPEKVLHVIESMMGYSTTGKTSNFEFQPIVRTHDRQSQVIAQFAYKF
jgi:hypothetical protein